VSYGGDVESKLGLEKLGVRRECVVFQVRCE
jgi:hypothetical protein